MKTINTFYNPRSKKTSDGLSITSILSWTTVLVVILMFWAGIAVVYKKDYVPHAVAKIEHKERKFLATHKAIQKRLTGIRGLV